MNAKIIIVFILTLFSSISFSEIDYVTVDAQGNGETKNEATQEALINAIGQVNGLQMAAKSKASLSYKATVKDNIEEEESFEELKETVSSKTKGVIRSWSVISAQPPSGEEYSLWEVEIKATIARHKMSAQVNRKRLAVVPFRVLSAVKEKDFSRLFAKSLNAYLTQSRKFAMIDRKYSHEQKKELRLIQGSNFKIEEAARTGNQLGADYLILGVIDNAHKKSNTIQMRTTGRSITKTKTQVDLSYRVLDVASGQIKYAGEFSKSFSGEVSFNEAAKVAANGVGRAIVAGIFPIHVVSVNGENITLGQGGKALKSGDILKLIKYGNKITDPYTGESLGRVEIEIGSVKITSVQAKTSTAKLFKLDVKYDGLDYRDQMIVRFTPSNDKDEDQEKAVETEKEIKQKSKDFDKDDDW
jgi:hypothetical protein